MPEVDSVKLPSTNTTPRTANTRDLSAWRDEEEESGSDTRTGGDVSHNLPSEVPPTQG